MTIVDPTTETVAADAVGPRLSARAADTLLPVLRVIPPHCYERSNARAWRLVARAVGVWLLGMAALAVTDRWYFMVALWVWSSLAVSGLFVLGHDAAHGALFESKVLNRRVGRWLMLPSLHVFEAWVVGHNRIHHGHTLRQGMDFVWHPETVEQFRSMTKFQRARHRFEWSAFGAGAYYLRSIWWEKMIRFSAPDRYRVAVRNDKRFLSVAVAVTVVGVTSVALAAGATVVGALWLIVKLIVVPFVGFCASIGTIVYVHHISPDIKWWPRRAWTSYRGQVEGTTVLRVPKALNSLFFYNIMVHVPHHVDVRIPCYRLPDAAAAIEAEFPDVIDRPLRWRDFARSTRVCKLYDFTTQSWLPYSAATNPR